MGDFHQVGEEAIWAGHVISLAVGSFVDPDGAPFERELVRHPGSVSVVPLLDDGDTVVLVRQYRAAIDRTLLEIPAGKLDVAGEAPEAAAARELEEEIGWTAGRLVLLAAYYNTPGFSDEHSRTYLALDLTQGTVAAHGIEERHMTVEHVRLSDIARLVADGTICDGKTIIGLTLAQEHLRGA